MKPSNYEIMRDRMRGQFLQYDQRTMIDRFQLAADEDFIYITFFSRPYRVGRHSGIVEWSENGFRSAEPADYNESMTIYDVLCCSKPDCHLSNAFVPTNSLKGVVYTAGSGAGSDLFWKYPWLFDKHPDRLSQACLRLGGVPEGKGDVAFRLPVFPFLPVRFEFWKSDEDFPPDISILWDGNVLSYMHYETLWFAAGHLMRRLTEIISDM